MPGKASLSREQVMARINRLSPEQLEQVGRFLDELERGPEVLLDNGSSAAVAPHRDWPHAPVHRICEHGTYIVTAGTWGKQHLFRRPERLDLLETSLLTLARKHGWQLEAWAVFSNHYHFVGHGTPESSDLNVFLRDVHVDTAIDVNRLDGEVGRKVWHNFWETQLTFERSYLARLNYVHQNAVKHGLVRVANQYRWCSAAWFERTASAAQVATIYGFKTDTVRVVDDFDMEEF